MDNHNLANCNWRGFTLSDLFQITSSKSGRDKNKLTQKTGDIPYITRSEKNNGYHSFIGTQDNKFGLNEGNVISIGLDTQTAFYQPIKFYTGQNIQILSNDKLNIYIALFLVPLLKRLMKNFNWGGNGATLTRLKRSKILLPVNYSGQPNWTFMEKYMKEKEQILLKKCITRFKENYVEEGIPLLSDKRWAEFYIKDIFPNIQRGKRLKNEDHLKGTMPYVSSTAMNNGVDDFVSNKEKVRIFSNCLTLANSGSVGVCFFQPFKFVASDHITKLENPLYNKYIYWFIATILARLSKKYSFNREINDNRIRKEKILLPVDENGNLDYEYMEKYMKKIEKKQIHIYLNYLVSEHKIVASWIHNQESN